MNIKVRLALACAVIFFGNIAAYVLYDLILGGGKFEIGPYLSTDFLVKVFKFPIVAISVLLIILSVEHFRNRNTSSVFQRISSRDCDVSTFEDFVYAVLGLASISRILSILFSFGIGFYLSKYIEKEFQFSFLVNAHVVFQFFCVLVLIPFFEYWHHRLMHTSYLWDIHKVHHAANHFNGLTTFRVHPLDSALAGPFRALPVALLGVRPDILAVYSLLNLAYQVWVHSEIYLDQPWLRRYFLIDPSLHRIHHSSDPRFYDKNFGILSFYDRVFGTWQDINQAPKSIPIGFSNDPIHNQAQPIRTMFRVFTNWLTNILRFHSK